MSTETTHNAPTLTFEIGEDGTVTCPHEGCGAPVVEVERGLAWRSLIADDGRVRSYEDSDSSWEGEGFQCHAGHPLNAPDDFEDLVDYC